MAAKPIPEDGRPFTIEELERLPEDGYRHELVRGRLVREPPPGAEHGGVTVEIGRLLGNFVRERGIGRVMAEAGFVLAGDPPTVRAPDVAFLAADRIPEAGLPAGYVTGAPDLAVEVVSPSNTLAEVRAKVLDYLAAGARAVWVVEPRTRGVTVYAAGGGVRDLGPGDELDGDEVLPGLRLPVAALFAR